MSCARNMKLSFENTDMSPGCLDVLNTAALLETTEFNVFRLAYRNWYGKNINDNEIERFYVPYMFREVVPPWVTSFCRMILKLEKSGKLNTRKYVPLERRPKRQEVSQFAMKLIIAINCLIILLMLADQAAVQMGLDERCMFPPCY